MSKFKQFKQLYQDNKFDVLLRDPESVFWLKLRSISRKELMTSFCTLIGLDCTNIKGSQLFEHIYNAKPDEKVVEKAFTTPIKITLR